MEKVAQNNSNSNDNSKDDYDDIRHYSNSTICATSNISRHTTGSTTSSSSD